MTPTHKLNGAARDAITRAAWNRVTAPTYPVPWHAFATCVWTNSAMTDDCGNPPWIVFDSPEERMAV